MKPYFRRSILCSTVALLCNTATAGYTVENGDLNVELNLGVGGASLWTRDVNFGAGRTDIRSGENTGSSADWQEFYLTPGATFTYSLSPETNLVAGASAVMATTLGDGDAGGFSRGSDGDTDIEELYAGFESNGWRFTAGNQNFIIGNGFIVMDGNLDFFDDGAFWLGPRTAFSDSAILRYDSDKFSAQGYSLKVDEHLGDFRMNGVNVDAYLGDNGMLGAMAMAVDSDNPSASRDGMEVYSARALGLSLPSLPQMTFSGEYAIQRGNGDGVDYDANAWYAETEYTFSTLPFEPRIGYRHAYFSGDGNLGDNSQKSWDPLSKGFVDWGTWLIGDVVGNYLLNNSNEVVDQVWLKAQLNPELAFGTIHYQFSLDENNLFGVPVADKDFADETVIYLDWTPTPNLYTSFSYNWVQPKAAAKTMLGDKDFSAVELYFLYRY